MKRSSALYVSHDVDVCCFKAQKDFNDDVRSKLGSNVQRGPCILSRLVRVAFSNG